MRRAARAIAAVALAGIVGCGAGGPATARPPRPRSASTGASTATTTRPAPLSASPAALVADAVGSVVRVYAIPHGSRPSLVLPNPWLLNGVSTQPIPQAFLVVRLGRDGWVQVRLPVRPNGTTGWLAPGSVRLQQDPYRIDVSRARHLLTVWRGRARVYTGRVAVGAPATPTPSGLFYLRVLLHNTTPGSVYGPYAYGLSAHSEALTTFNGGDAEIGLHGNNDPRALGHSVTHGCIRMSNAEIIALARLLPLGTPVRVQ